MNPLTRLHTRSRPWLAGAALAAGQIGLARCTALAAGQCSSCGGCLLAVGALAAWAVRKRRADGNPCVDPFEPGR